MTEKDLQEAIKECNFHIEKCKSKIKKLRSEISDTESELISFDIKRSSLQELLRRLTLSMPVNQEITLDEIDKARFKEVFKELKHKI